MMDHIKQINIIKLILFTAFIYLVTEISAVKSSSTASDASDSHIVEILSSGGSYALPENQSAQALWQELQQYIEARDSEEINLIHLPIDLNFHWFAYQQKQAPTYLITTPYSGAMTIIVNSKSNFLPKITVNNKVITNKNDVSVNDINAVIIPVFKGETYQVNIERDEDLTGLYSIVARIDASDDKFSLNNSLLATTGFAIKDGRIIIWGNRNSGQQGNGVKVVDNNTAPQFLNSLTNIIHATGGAFHLLALDSNSDVWSWGKNNNGEVGHFLDMVETPYKVLGNIRQIATGNFFSIALDHYGNVWTWGQNLYGQLGNDNNKTHDKTPTIVNLNNEKVRLIGAANEGAFAITEQGRVWVWGNNEGSGLGFAGTEYGVRSITRKPVRALNLESYAKKITYISGGNGWGEALLDDGTVIGWGIHIALGKGSTNISLVKALPEVIFKNVKQLFARYYGSVALTTEGKLYTWGLTKEKSMKVFYGEIVTRQSAQNRKISAIGGGKEYILYQTEDGKIYSVGYNILYTKNKHRINESISEWPGTEVQLPKAN